VNGLAEIGFAIDSLAELPDLSDGDRRGRRRSGGAGGAEIPLFLALRARR